MSSPQLMQEEEELARNEMSSTHITNDSGAMNFLLCIGNTTT
jgi:hypothetical protein